MGHLGMYAHDATGVWSSRIDNLGAVAALATTPCANATPGKPRGQALQRVPESRPGASLASARVT